ncbi:putative SWI/SNF-related matrix-associated actin-dependent regulator of chromatin subfamily A member 3-like 1 [Vitis vinifera]|uniref:Putative SWI/SNF-related matrix-associated actin-dependent regulator of chromatin subfamily A member 3-like 1 n=1 Tax=Vitis vinifera TaxID=29760 RepID=A0A438J7N2_VITVI|nr:putative SWI/SNF-related matrix-associated actin-dependent regulator of chromatin subfamily A member 3-like 1 [Vitis vinifera]
MDEEDPVSLFMSLDHWREFPIDADDDEDSSQCPLSSPSETYLVGFVIVNIVGIQYYSGTISGRERVGLVREPLNPYDRNAIKVLNTTTIQVGHIDRSAAAVLAPLMDANLVTVEGIVPNTPGSGNRYRIPCQVHIFAQIEWFPRVRSAISRGGLQLISDSDPSFTLSEAVIVKEKKCDKEFKSLDEIFKLAIENVNKQGALEAMEPPKDVIKSELFLHQKEALGWLVHRENSCELPPFWEKQNGSYVNVLTNYQTNKRPEPLRGGIFADDMGLGKTLTLLCLIAFDKCSSDLSYSVNRDNIEKLGEEDEELIVSSGKKSRKGRVSRKASGLRKKRKTDDTPSDDMLKGNSVGASHKFSTVLVSKTTLIVCPPSVFSTWVTQLLEHTTPKRLKVYMYYGNRTQEAEELQKYDIVLTTYSTLATEEAWSGSPVKKIEWWRVILDEAHMIKNVNAQQSQAVTNLRAKRRWVVTGTPIQNGTFDLFSLMAFLRFEPFSIKSYWQSLVQRPLGQGKEKGLSRLQQFYVLIHCPFIKFNCGSNACLIQVNASLSAIHEMLINLMIHQGKWYCSQSNYMRNIRPMCNILFLWRRKIFLLCHKEWKYGERFGGRRCQDAQCRPQLAYGLFGKLPFREEEVVLFGGRREVAKFGVVGTIKEEAEFGGSQVDKVLMATISLRRTKDKGLIGLPPKSVETCFVELSAEERELYDQMEAEGKCVIRDYIDAGSVMRNYSTVLGIILRLRQICTDVALCPSDLRSLLLSNNIEVSVNSISASNKAKSMGSKFQACGFVASVKAVIWKWRNYLSLIVGDSISELQKCLLESLTREKGWNPKLVVNHMNSEVEVLEDSRMGRKEAWVERFGSRP